MPRGWEVWWGANGIRSIKGLFEDARASVPRTVELLAGVEGLIHASFSILAPGTYLWPHRGPNTGAMRALLGIVVPEPGACGMLVADRRLDLEEGRLIAFDDTFEHAAWNLGSVERVSLLLEVRHPAKGFPDVFNRMCQRAFHHYPMNARGIRSFSEQLAGA